MCIFFFVLYTISDQDIFRIAQPFDHVFFFFFCNMRDLKEYCVGMSKKKVLRAIKTRRVKKKKKQTRASFSHILWIGKTKASKTWRVRRFVARTLCKKARTLIARSPRATLQSHICRYIFFNPTFFAAMCTQRRRFNFAQKKKTRRAQRDEKPIDKINNYSFVLESL